MSWNLFHGRDFPPDPGPAGFGWKVLGRPVRGSGHVLLNRDLFNEFGALLAAADWDIALLQEVPPRWDERLAAATGATHHRALTSRNWMSPVMSPIARLRPHLPGSWEGGSNLILVRSGKPGATIVTWNNRTLCRLPERRVLSMVELGGGLCLANLHASTGRLNGERDVLLAARLATEWAGDLPLVLGGDFNIRPRSSSAFEELRLKYGFEPPAEDDSIDHLLLRNGQMAEPVTGWNPKRRDVPDFESGLAVRLSDHSPVVCRITV